MLGQERSSSSSRYEMIRRHTLRRSSADFVSSVRIGSSLHLASSRSYVSFSIVDLFKGLFYDLHYRFKRPANLMSGKTDLSDMHGPSQTSGFPKCTLEYGRYVSPWCNDADKSVANVISWLSTRKQNKLNFPSLPKGTPSHSLIPVHAVDTVRVNGHAASVASNPEQGQQALFTWLGHASCLYQSEGVSFITDPVWSRRCSPSQQFGPERFMPPPVPIEELGLDVVLLSHTHYDHLDYATAQRLGNSVLWIVPLGVKALLESGFNITNVVELDWWDTYSITSSKSGKELSVVFLPSKHWTSRSPFDRNTCLWGGFAVISDSNRFYFAGDTAYCDVFETIGRHLGPFDIAAIPIGAYKPRWFMKASHCDPAEALRIHEDVRAKVSCAVHWGTFPLADEDFVEPALELARAREARAAEGVNSNFFTAAHGETIDVSAGSAPARGTNDFATLFPDLLDHYKRVYNEKLQKHRLSFNS